MEMEVQVGEHAERCSTMSRASAVQSADGAAGSGVVESWHVEMRHPTTASVCAAGCEALCVVELIGGYGDSESHFGQYALYALCVLSPSLDWSGGCHSPKYYGRMESSGQMTVVEDA